MSDIARDVDGEHAENSVREIHIFLFIIHFYLPLFIADVKMFLHNCPTGINKYYYYRKRAIALQK